MTPRSGAGLGGKILSVTGEGKAAAEPAQVKTLSSPAAPKPTHEEQRDIVASATNVVVTAPAVQAGDEAQAGAEAGAAAETVDPATGEIIVLAQRKAQADANNAADAGADAVTARSHEQVTVLAKPEKRKSAKERAQARVAKASPAAEAGAPESLAEDGTTPDMTAKAKSKAGAKSEEVLAANEARKERKAAAKAKAKDSAGAKSGTKAKAEKTAGKTAGKTVKKAAVKTAGR